MAMTTTMHDQRKAKTGEVTDLELFGRLSGDDPVAQAALTVLYRR